MAFAPYSYEATVLEWYLEQGVTDLLDNKPVDRLAARDPLPFSSPQSSAPSSSGASMPIISELPLGTMEAKAEALRLAGAAGTLLELETVIRNFEGLTIRKTATNIVFSDGNPASRVMIIGEAPGGDEDIQGKPFVGVSGQLLDKMLSAIGLDRNSEDPARSVYITNVLNWRPPGNRSPSPSEIEISLPFIERHIALAQPKLLLFMGAIPSRSLLNCSDTVLKLRGAWHVYTPVTLTGGREIPCLATYHPTQLLRTPLQKKAAWADLQLLRSKVAEFTSK